MNVYLNNITGIDDAITTMFFSKRTWTRNLENDVRDTCDKVFNRSGMWLPDAPEASVEKLNGWINQLVRWGWMHTTMLRFVDFSLTVEGLHRAGQDDWDAHASRYNNRIIRSSTRLADFGNEMSDYYKGKIIPTDQALSILEISTPDKIVLDGVPYVKTVNGYIREDMKDNKDVKRGLYMLSIPSNFIFKVNLTELAHVYKERNEMGSANPEVKECCETVADLIASVIPQFSKELLLRIRN